MVNTGNRVRSPRGQKGWKSEYRGKDLEQEE